MTVSQRYKICILVRRIPKFTPQSRAEVVLQVLNEGHLASHSLTRCRPHPWEGPLIAF